MHGSHWRAPTFCWGMLMRFIDLQLPVKEEKEEDNDGVSLYSVIQS